MYYQVFNKIGTCCRPRKVRALKASRKWCRWLAHVSLANWNRRLFTPTSWRTNWPGNWTMVVCFASWQNLEQSSIGLIKTYSQNCLFSLKLCTRLVLNWMLAILFIWFSSYFLIFTEQVEYGRDLVGNGGSIPAETVSRLRSSPSGWRWTAMDWFGPRGGLP